MKSMSWICQGRLGEYHYYCPFANVDSLYPQGLRSNPSQRVLPLSAKETLKKKKKEKKKKGWADDKDWKSSVTGKFRLHQFSERWISFLTTPMKSIVPKIKVLTFVMEESDYLTEMSLQTQPSPKTNSRIFDILDFLRWNQVFYK